MNFEKGLKYASAFIDAASPKYQGRISNPFEHLRWIFFVEIVNGF